MFEVSRERFRNSHARILNLREHFRLRAACGTAICMRPSDRKSVQLEFEADGRDISAALGHDVGQVPELKATVSYEISLSDLRLETTVWMTYWFVLHAPPTKPQKLI